MSRDVPGIVTPEAVVLEFDTAGAGSRGVAELLDLLLMAATFYLVVLVLTVGLAASGGGDGVAVAAVIAVLVLFMVVVFGYPIGAETIFNGRTLGKAALGVRVVTVEGGPVRFRHAAIRGLVGFVEIILTFGVVALLAILFSKKNQRLGDMVAGTIVLRERTASKRAVAVSFPPPPGLEAYVHGLDVTSVTPDEYAVVRSFLVRAPKLTDLARAGLAVRLANPLALQLRHRPPAGIGPERFLACVAAAYQLRHGGPLWLGPTWPTWPTWPTGAGAAPGGPPTPGPGHQGSPGWGSPGQGYPGQGSPGQGYPGQGYPGQGSPGQGSPGQGGPAPEPALPGLVGGPAVRPGDAWR